VGETWDLWEEWVEAWVEEWEAAWEEAWVEAWEEALEEVLEVTAGDLYTLSQAVVLKSADEGLLNPNGSSDLK
jgi:hypothetical protein